MGVKVNAAVAGFVMSSGMTFKSGNSGRSMFRECMHV